MSERDPHAVQGWTVDQYPAEPPEDRCDTIARVRQMILERLPDGYIEGMNWRMIAYQVPPSRYPDTHNGQPLMLAGVTSQKNHMAVHLSAITADERRRITFEGAYRATGKRFDVGKSCVRFKKLDALPPDLIGQTIASVSVEEFIAIHESVHSKRRAR